MTATEDGFPPTREPLYRAATLLEGSAHGGSPTGSSPVEPERGEVRRAIRAAALAVEKHMDAIEGGGGGLASDIGTEHPRLLPALHHLEASLARLLVDIWEASIDEPQLSNSEAFASRLQRLAGQLRHAADAEVDLLYESLNEPMGLD